MKKLAVMLGLLVMVLGLGVGVAEETRAIPPLAQAIRATVGEIARTVESLARALPPLDTRLAPVRQILEELRALGADGDEVDVEQVKVLLVRLDLHLHRLVFDLERGWAQRQRAQERTREFVEKITARMSPETAARVRELVQELGTLIREELREEAPGLARPELLHRLIEELKAALNRLDALLLRVLEGSSL